MVFFMSIAALGPLSYKLVVSCLHWNNLIEKTMAVALVIFAGIIAGFMGLRALVLTTMPFIVLECGCSLIFHISFSWQRVLGFWLISQIFFHRHYFTKEPETSAHGLG